MFVRLILIISYQHDSYIVSSLKAFQDFFFLFQCDGLRLIGGDKPTSSAELTLRVIV